MVELLAPAGDYECFIAALKGGADAVYLGLKSFGARANASNFSEEELLKALNKAHLFGKKIYLTVNTLFKDDEFFALYQALKQPYIHGLDGVIVQDVGVVEFIREHFPGLDIHASTQMAITDTGGIRFARNLGISRCVPARELSLEEIKRIHDETGMELECFVHGAMCYSYSGKCLFSSMLGDRSGNRGRCAQPCRLCYDNEYILSMKDMCAIDLIPQLIEAGIYSFKIEGRMKSPEYVYGVTSIYRKYIDLYLNGEFSKVSKEDKNSLLSLYTRGGNIEGYYFQKNGRKMITIQSPAYTSSDTDVRYECIGENKIEVAIECRLEINKPIKGKITIVDNKSEYKGVFFEAESDFVVQKALKSPVDVEMVKKQLIKTGDTDLRIVQCEVTIDGECFAANGQLNAFRRMLISGLLSKVFASNRNAGDIKEYMVPVAEINECSEKRLLDILRISILNISQLKYILEMECSFDVIIPIAMIDKIVKDTILQNLLAKVNCGLKIYIKLPYIVRNCAKGIGEKRIVELLNLFNDIINRGCGRKIDGYYISNYESLRLLKENGFEGEFVGDIHLYAYNKNAYNVLRKSGINTTSVPIELNYSELTRRGIENEELIIYGRTPMMISSQCIKCTKEGCKYNNDGYLMYITDRKGIKFPVLCNCFECTNVCYNSLPTSIASEYRIIKNIRPSSYRIDFTVEDTKEICDIISKAYLMIDNFNTNNDITNELCAKYTKGHLKRGVE